MTRFSILIFRRIFRQQWKVIPVFRWQFKHEYQVISLAQNSSRRRSRKFWSTSLLFLNQWISFLDLWISPSPLDFFSIYLLWLWTSLGFFFFRLSLTSALSSLSSLFRETFFIGLERQPHPPISQGLEIELWGMKHMWSGYNRLLQSGVHEDYGTCAGP